MRSALRCVRNLNPIGHLGQLYFEDKQVGKMSMKRLGGLKAGKNMNLDTAWEDLPKRKKEIGRFEPASPVNSVACTLTTSSKSVKMAKWLKQGLTSSFKIKGTRPALEPPMDKTMLLRSTSSNSSFKQRQRKRASERYPQPSLLKELASQGYLVQKIAHGYLQAKTSDEDVTITLRDNFPSNIEATFKEIQVLRLCDDHPFIYKYKNLVVLEKKICFMTERLHGGSLRRRINRLHKMKIDDVCFYAAEIVCALGYLHEKAVAYNYLSLSNVLIAKTGHVKLANMREATFEPITSTPGAFDENAVVDESDAILDDWQNLGVVVFELLVGQKPSIEHHSSRHLREESGRRCIVCKIPNSVKLDPVVRGFISSLFNTTLPIRLGSIAKGGTRGVMEHEFFKGIDWDDVKLLKLVPPYVPANET